MINNSNEENIIFLNKVNKQIQLQLFIYSRSIVQMSILLTIVLKQQHAEVIELFMNKYFKQRKENFQLISQKSINYVIDKTKTTEWNKLF